MSFPQEPFSSESASAKNRRIVLVDDSPDSAESLAEILSLWGHSVWLAEDGLSGIAKTKEIRPDVVILDIGLPGMDGYEVARRLRQEPEVEPVTLFALTGYNPDTGREQSAGFQEYFTKPVDLDRLQKALEASHLRP